MTAVLLPLPRFVAYNASTGDPVAGGFLYPLNPSTMLPKQTWADAGQTVANTHPILLDSAGSCLLYGEGTYFLQCTDALGNVVAAYCGNTDALDFANNTTDPSGSCLVGYYHAITGFHGRMVCERLLDRVSTLDFGADNTGAADATAHIQAAINYVQSIGGGTVLVKAGTYLVAGTLTITGAGVELIGDAQFGSTINFQNGAANGIAIGAGSVVYGTVIRDLTLHGVGKTGGYIISATNFANAEFSGLTLSGAVNGMALRQSNNIKISFCQVLIQVGGGTVGISWSSPTNNLQRSDVLTIEDTVVACNGHGVAGISVDGMCQTLRMSRVGVLNSRVGLEILNTASSNTFFPAFINCVDLEIDGVDQNCVLINGGRVMKFINCDFFSAGGNGADTDTVSINADGSASVTAEIKFIGCRMGGAQQRGVYCEAKQVDIISCTISSTSLAGLNLHAAILLADHGGGGPNSYAVGITIADCRFYEYGATANNLSAVVVQNLCTQINIVGCNFVNVNPPTIVDNSGGLGNVTWSGCIDFTGVPMPNRLPLVALDPASPLEGEMWENAASGLLKAFLGGVVRVINTTP